MKTSTNAMAPRRALWLARVLLLLLSMPSVLQTAQAHGQQTQPSSSPAAPTRPLTDVSQVRRLTPQQAARAFPVRLTGVVTALSGTEDDFFFQDATGGISIDRSDHTQVHVGDRVEIQGISDPGMFAPSVISKAVRILGRSPLPQARAVTYGDMVGGAQDSRWVEVTGVVHDAHMIQVFDHDTLLLVLDLGGGTVRILLQDFAGLNYSRLVDATLRVRGVCATSFNEKRQFVGIALFVPDRKDMDVVAAAPIDPFAVPATPVRDALQFGQTAHRVKVAGTVTYQSPGHALYLQDGLDGIKIQTPFKQVIAPGTRVEALGFPAVGEYSPELSYGIVRVLGPGQPIAPQQIDPRRAIFYKKKFLQAPYDQQLVQLQGTVVESHIQSGQRVLILNNQGETFQAYLPLAATGPQNMAGFRPGSVLMLTGICTVHTDSERMPESFSILLRSAHDVTVLEKASWWTPGHTLALLTILAAVTMLVALWVVILRNRVREQTRIIRESEERYRNLAQNDVLTGLPNRLMLEERIHALIERCNADKLKAAFFTIDIDRFKLINDTYGHQTADEILKTVADRLRSRVRSMDIIARTGGEEFTLVFGSLSNIESARKVASAMLDLFIEPVTVSDGREIKTTVSIGGAMYPDDGTDTVLLHKRSDQALYEAKRTGRNRAIFASEEITAVSELATQLERSVRDGLRLDKFALNYQPLYDQNGTIRRFEALLRTTDERLAEAGLTKFIPVAEECGLILPLGRWVLEEACRQLAAWKPVLSHQCPIAINVSGRQLGHKGFADEVLQTLARFELDPPLLQIELTETTLMTDLGSVREAIDRLAAAGLTFAIDDFGTGYSSLSRLHELPIKTLKIDRTFVQSLEQSGGTGSIVGAIIHMAKGLSVQVVAEGVENAAQLATLKQMGCDLFQGYLFSRPVNAATALRLLAENRGISPADLQANVAAAVSLTSWGVSPTTV